MLIGPAFSMEDDDISSAVEEQSKDLKEPSPRNDTDQKEDSSADLKKDTPKSAKPAKKSRGWCCISRTNDDD